MQQPVISLLHATRERPQEMIACMKRWKELSSGTIAYEHILSLDADCLLKDTLVRKETHDAVSRLGAVWEHVQVKSIFGCPCNSVSAWNRASAKSTGSVLIQLSDDFHPPKDWDKTIAARFGGEKNLHQPMLLGVSAPNGLAGPYSGDGVQTIAIMTRALINHLGYFLYHEYPSVWSDNDITQTAAIRGYLILAPDVVFRHDWKGEFADATYKHQNDSNAVYQGTRIYGHRLAALFPSIDHKGEDIILHSFPKEEGERRIKAMNLGTPNVLYGHLVEIWTQRRLRGYGTTRNLPFAANTAMEAAMRGDWPVVKQRVLPLLRKYQNASFDQGKFFFHGGVYLWNLADSFLGNKEQMTRTDSAR